MTRAVQAFAPLNGASTGMSTRNPAILSLGQRIALAPSLTPWWMAAANVAWTKNGSGG
jgi:hypothetical protein